MSYQSTSPIRRYFGCPAVVECVVSLHLVEFLVSALNSEPESEITWAGASKRGKVTLQPETFHISTPPIAYTQVTTYITLYNASLESNIAMPPKKEAKEKVVKGDEGEHFPSAKGK